ncbi:50S ribosomal protein L29 [Mycoplasma phocoenae]|uniref:Large ribosomal subunit protein uL29 n=1 Tax=Mycoplasma phocoenae TaxID=754517 RepID=A0A858U4Z2_9MOLU|nr:50S ribosomal protein L29 [Mycoplasma phocoenae]QJG67139.1 50S ribosomal protein L29 [Mycoplasma phocoenae]
MKYAELKTKSIAELEKMVDDLSALAFQLRQRSKTGQLDTPHKIKANKKDIARILTAINEKKAAGETK